MSSTADFDFIFGRWAVANRRLAARGVGSDQWDEFPAESWTAPLLGGVAHMEEVHFPTKGFSGLTLRTFEPAADRWAIRWINSNDGVVQPPVYGSFDGLLGEFYGDDHDDGRPIKVVFRWFVDPDSPRWEQAFSYDEGATWETNWTMALTRLSGPGT